MAGGVLDVPALRGVRGVDSDPVLCWGGPVSVSRGGGNDDRRFRLVDNPDHVTK